MAKYHIDAINACMRTAQDNTSRFGAVGDRFPEGAANAADYGGLPSSSAVASAVGALNTLLTDEFAAAESTLDGVARALDAVARTVSNTEDAHAAAMTAR